MSYLKKIFVLLYPMMILSLLGCPQAFKVPVEVPVVIQRDYTQIKIADPDREDILKRAKKKKDKNSKLCEKDEKCEDICEDIFPRGDRDDCEELSVKQVKRIEALHELFEDPDINDLEDIEIGDGEDLNLYLNISIEPLDKLVSKYKKREAEDFLIWLAEFPDAVEIISKEDEDYNLLEALLKRIGAGDFDSFKKVIDGDETFVEIAIESDNEDLLEWIFEYLEDEHTNCSDDEDEDKRKECLLAWCDVAYEMSDDSYAEDLLDYDFFEEYLEGIIEDEINGDNDISVETAASDGVEIGDCSGLDREWNADNDAQDCDETGYQYIEDVDDLEQWWVDLCPK